MLFRTKTELPTADTALHGRERYDFEIPDTHYVTGRPITAPFPDGLETAVFGLGCFWGAEEVFWQTEGVWTTAVGYAGGFTSHPSYEEVCSGRTGHTEAVLVVYDPKIVSFAKLVAIFFEVHDPTQGMRQGNDVGTQYRSAIYYTNDQQKAVAEQARTVFARTLGPLGYGAVTTEIAPAGPLSEPASEAVSSASQPARSPAGFFYAEGYHQQYLAKNPNGYRCHATTGIAFPLAELTTSA